MGFGSLQGTIHPLIGLGLGLLLHLVAPSTTCRQIGAQPIDRVPPTRSFDLLRGHVTTRIVGGGVGPESIGHGLDESRPVAR